MNRRGRRLSLPSLREQAVPVQRRSQHHYDLTIGTLAQKKRTESGPDGRTIQSVPRSTTEP
jgi:hypothetical protein